MKNDHEQEKMNKRKLSYDEDTVYNNSFTLSQKRAIKSVLNGQNVFISGAWSSGKTECALQILKLFTARGIKTAYSCETGKYESLSDLMGYDSLQTSMDNIANEILKKKFKCSVLQSYRVLIIDDISFIDSFQFELTDYVFKKIKNNKLPFGGLQIILVGDFYQRSSKHPIFQSHLFWKTIESCKILEDFSKNEFLKILNKCRKITDVKLFHECIRSQTEFGIVPSIILNGDVQDQNTKKEFELESKEVQVCNLKLKIGSQVILTEDLNDIKSGSRGIVTEFINSLPTVQFICGQKVCMNENIPLKIAWYLNAQTLKSFSVDCAEIDIRNKDFIYLLSRVKSLQCLYLKNIPQTIEISKEIYHFYEIPFLVQKAIKNHDNEEFEVDVDDSELIAFTQMLQSNLN
jgi:hypothetical protein